MLLAEAAAIIGIEETTRVYYGKMIFSPPNKPPVVEEATVSYPGFSPVTLHNGWPLVWRIFFLLLYTVLGTMVNGIFVATFFTSEVLKKKGNIFLACLGLTDLIITGIVVPIVIFIMISNGYESPLVCRGLHFLTQWSTYAYSVFYLLVAVDMYIRLVKGYMSYLRCVSRPLCGIALLNYMVSLGTAAAGVYYGLEYDYCNRGHYGNLVFRGLTAIIFYMIPCTVTISLLASISHVMHDRVVRLFRLKRLPVFERDRNLANLHIGCFLLFVAAWTPYFVVVNLFPDSDDARYYVFIWIGLVRSAVTSILYSTLNGNIRRAFHDLFIYLCCKGRLQNGRPRRIFGIAPSGAMVLRNMDLDSPRFREQPVQHVL